MISLVAQCGKCGQRWGTGAVRDVQSLGFAVTMLAKSIEAGSPICLECAGESGASASDVETKQHERAIELAKGTNLPECPFCEAIGRELLEVESLAPGEELECCEEGAEIGWWGPPTGVVVAKQEVAIDIRWHRKSLEERPS